MFILHKRDFSSRNSETCESFPNRSSLMGFYVKLFLRTLQPVLPTLRIQNVSLHFTVWKFKDFFYHSILREINFCWFQQVKNCHFSNFGCSDIWFLRKCHIWKCQRFPKIWNSGMHINGQNRGFRGSNSFDFT